ncbi:hypothetical protein K3495_g12711 [Podosphaera aphanis]|nr:hypothetical protein K3495_g12711 [Podosphaera aphanis]
MAKIYTEEQKYSGTNDSFDFKMRFFFDICNRADVPHEAYLKALPTMLKGLALDIYYINELSSMISTQNLSEWNSINLKTVIVANPGKSISDYLLLLVQEVTKLQHGLREALQTVEYLHDKLVTACQGVPACRFAVSDPPSSLGASVNKLQPSIIAYEKENVQSEAFFTDRRYHKNFNSPKIENAAQCCYVCQKEDCRSWNHTDQERQNFKNEFKSEFKNKLKPRSYNDKHFQRRFRQYTVYCEGDYKNEEDDPSETELDDVFDSLVVNFNENSLTCDSNDKNTNSFCTSYGQMGEIHATCTVEEL